MKPVTRSQNVGRCPHARAPSRCLVVLSLVLFAMSLVGVGSAAAQSKKRKKRNKRARASEPAPKPDSSADSEPALQPDAKPDKKDAVQVFDFTGIDISGRLRAPQLLYFLDRAQEELERASLQRRSFVPEMIRSLDEEAL